MLRIEESTAEAVSAYVAGWAVSRGAPEPTRTPLGWHVATDQAHESQRAVPVRGSVTEVLQVANGLRKPLSCLKFAGSYDDWRPHFGPEWTDNPIGWFMITRLSRQEVGTIAGHAEVEADGRLLSARILRDGEVVASGRIGMAGEWCVPDRIRTGDRYRRQGLGSAVMRLLLAAARDAGADRAVLDASLDGRGLYEAMGWTMRSAQFGLTGRASSGGVGQGPGRPG